MATTTTQNKAQKIVSAIEKLYQVVHTAECGKDLSDKTIVVECKGKNFAVCSAMDNDSVTVYGCFQEASGDWTFLPSCKTVKSAKGAVNFIDSRTK
jgi:hypothetical protein